MEIIKIHNQDFILHPSGAMYWTNEKMLLIADVHLGKVSHFRKFGSAIPPQVLLENFRKLNIVSKAFDSSTICFLGDLFHSHINAEWNLFEDWVALQESKIILIAGNHDIISPLYYEALKIELVKELVIKNFLLTHHPNVRKNLFNITGHIHPGIQVNGSGRQHIAVPCFFKSSQQLILPAFGAFTGKHILKPKRGDKVYATVGDEIIPINLK